MPEKRQRRDFRAWLNAAANHPASRASRSPGTRGGSGGFAKHGLVFVARICHLGGCAAPRTPTLPLSHIPGSPQPNSFFTRPREAAPAAALLEDRFSLLLVRVVVTRSSCP